VTDAANSDIAPASPPPSPRPPLPPELEARLAAFENAAPAADFDVAGWFWMILFGAVIPLAMLAIGWWA